MKLDSKNRALVAIGAPIAAYCAECLAGTAGMGNERGIEEENIETAVGIGKPVGTGAAARINQLAASATVELSHKAPALEGAAGADLRCAEARVATISGFFRR